MYIYTYTVYMCPSRNFICFLYNVILLAIKHDLIRYNSNKSCWTKGKPNLFLKKLIVNLDRTK